MTKQFRTAARRGVTNVKNPVPVDFEYEVNDDEFITMTAQPPTTGQVALYAISQTEGGLEAVNGVFTLLRQVLSDEDWAVIEADLDDGVDVAIPFEIVNYCVGEWGSRPTTPPSGSAPSRRTGGARSTAKPRRKVSTSSTSRSTAS